MSITPTFFKPMPARKKEMFCNFCGKERSAVEILIAGPGVNICDECVDLCQELINSKQKSRKKGKDSAGKKTGR